MKRWAILTVFLSLLSTLLFACSNTTTENTNNVQVTLSDFKIESSQTTFDHNTAYHFTIVNKGALAHEFMIVPPISHSTMPMDDMHKMALAHIENIDVGATKTLNFTFPQPAPAGKLEFACHLEGHYASGMHLGIVVT
ncbi:MAG: hypothetical protein E6J34_10260 [Chloroflexi bacterium]|nr:MAG: hypothetical protein E6J34_10260 [Chloroflexota bacterium]